ncbi:beta-D-xylosidase [Achlya hypogyna]|uniref:Beta-D-xylosidase n=1 Tax=Achlya hypogyna TaxID=1202772 RepID=A0A1V9ZH03_ACHHY|nr:beta-D-xylosidase [Achlya hypogyna]
MRFPWLVTAAFAGPTPFTSREPIDTVCDREPQRNFPFCNSSLPLDTRVDDLVGRIPLLDIPGLLGDNSTGSPSAGIPPYNWWSEGLHGVAVSPAVRFTAPTIAATSFPQVLSLAASFNRTLWHAIGSAIATEARAFHSVGHGGLTYWAPNINIYRDPRWGRGQETPGEDPFLTATYATAFVTGMQVGEHPTFLKVSACCKHLSAYSQEVPRHSLSAAVTPQDYADTYLPAFRACVVEGQVSAVMCSYNAVNGVPSCADRHLLTTVLKRRWRFDGYVVSDCGAVQDVLDQHHYTNSTGATCAATLGAGMDLNCGSFVQQHLPAALTTGAVTPATARRALRALLRVQFRLGLFEPVATRPFADSSVADIDTPAHRALAYAAAAQSLVLLRNEKTLPLDRDAFTATQRLVLLGPHVNASTAFLGSYAGVPPFVTTPLQGLAAHVPPTFTHAVAGSAIAGGDVDPAAVALASAPTTRQVVLFLGLDQRLESEGMDRAELRLPEVQLALFRAVVAAATAPVVVVVVAGGAVDVAEFKAHPNVGALVYAGYPGQAGGAAIADMLVGDVNPSGRLTMTLYPASFVQAVALGDMRMRPTASTPGRTHRFYTGDAVYPFGHGLSYTTFRYDVGAAPDALVAGDSWTGVFAVHNVGELIGDDVLLCFAEPPGAGTDGRPRQSLVAFDKVATLVPGDVFAWRVTVPAAAFRLATPAGRFAYAPGTWRLRVGNAVANVTLVVPQAADTAVG